jgi:tetratricopeptide (TPR) repeat protein
VGLAFVPEICPAVETTGYCYSPEKIKEVADRNECLLYLYTKYPKDAFADDKLEPVVDYLKESLAYSSLGGDYGIVTIQSGFEKLYSEFLVMMGDDAVTAALSSRFDLAGVTIGDFPGSQLETGGVDLSGLAGGEMRNLYKASQYFQAVLDRFQRNWLLLAKLEKADFNKIVEAKMATTYLDKVIEAAKKKAKAWSYIGQRYHNLGSPELARTVIERAYSAAFFENMLISSAIRTVLVASKAEKRAEIRANLKKAQAGFSMALIRMQDDSSKMNAELNYFGYRENYIPFPGLEAGAGRDNGFEVQINRAKER